jgi:ketosteroid isomerase-like protein
MSADKVEIVRRFWDAIVIRREFDEAVQYVHADAEFDWSDSRAPYAGVYRGAAEGRQLWATWLEAWEVWVPQITEAIEIDPETAVIVTSVEARGQGSGVTVRAGGASLWQVRDGKIAYARLFQSKEEALAAVSPPAT